MTKRERAYFGAAKAVSELSDHRCKIGAIVVLKHRIVSSACNSDCKTHPLQKRYNRYRFSEDPPHKCHAELLALIPLIKNNVDLSNASIYTYRQHRDGSLACARPCPSCMELIKDVRITRLFYTTDDGFAREYLKL